MIYFDAHNEISNFSWQKSLMNLSLEKPKSYSFYLRVEQKKIISILVPASTLGKILLFNLQVPKEKAEGENFWLNLQVVTKNS